MRSGSLLVAAAVALMALGACRNGSNNAADSNGVGGGSAAGQVSSPAGGAAGSATTPATGGATPGDSTGTGAAAAPGATGTAGTAGTIPPGGSTMDTTQPATKKGKKRP